MSQNKNVIIGVVIAALVIGAGAYFFFNRDTSEPPPPATSRRPKDLPCPNGTKEYTMESGEMKGLLEQGQKFKVTENWYACNPLEKGALVHYRFSESRDPVVRVVRAVGGDKFELVKDKKKGNWNVEINGDLLIDENTKEPYFFGGSAATPVMGLYGKGEKKTLAEGDLLIFSTVAPGGLDSGTFGVVNIDDMVGKVDPE